MKNFDRLKHRVEDGSIRLIHVEAVPRSIGTALSRALNEAGNSSVYVNEAFNSMRHDIDEASGVILKAVEANQAANTHLTVITKNLSRNLTLSLFEQWVSVCDGVVWSVRGPLTQIGSLITRVANDLAFEPGLDRLSQAELTADQIQAACTYLENVPTPHGFSKTCWSDMRLHFMSGSAKHTVSVDGGDLTANPTDTLRRAATALDLPFSARMVDGWTKGYIRANPGHNPKLADSERAWTKQAVTSTGIMASTRRPIDIRSLTPSMQNYLYEVAIPTYELIRPY
jgi:hypothetical protein